MINKAYLDIQTLDDNKPLMAILIVKNSIYVIINRGSFNRELTTLDISEVISEVINNSIHTQVAKFCIYVNIANNDLELINNLLNCIDAFDIKVLTTWVPSYILDILKQYDIKALNYISIKEANINITSASADHTFSFENHSNKVYVKDGLHRVFKVFSKLESYQLGYVIDTVLGSGYYKLVPEFRKLYGFDYINNCIKHRPYEFTAVNVFNALSEITLLELVNEIG